MRKMTMLIVAILALTMMSGCFVTGRGRRCGKGKCPKSECSKTKQEKCSKMKKAKCGKMEKKKCCKMKTAPAKACPKCGKPAGSAECCKPAK